MGTPFDQIPDLSSPPITELDMSVDPIPYAQWGLNGRYPRQVMPDTIPPVYSILGATDSNFNPDTLSTDGKRNLNVNIAAGGASGGGGLAPQGWGSHNVSSLDFSVAANSTNEVSGTGRTYVLGVGVTLRPDVGATPSGAGIVDYTFIKNFGDASIFCNFCQLVVDVTNSAQSTVQSRTVMFPVPLSIASAPYVVFRVTNGLGYAIRASVQSIFV